MIGCDVDRLEALVAGTLSAGPAAETRAHVAACVRCADEIRWLREERRVFQDRLQARPEVPAEAVPPFAAVLAEVREKARRPGHRDLAADRVGALRDRLFPRGLRTGVPWLAAAASLALVIHAIPGAAPEALPEPPPSFACYDDPRSLVAEATAYATDRAIASAEDRYGACLVATPGAELAVTRPVDSDVTCSPLGPLDDEVFESRIRGGSRR
jgi:hypothetical protein